MSSVEPELELDGLFNLLIAALTKFLFWIKENILEGFQVNYDRCKFHIDNYQKTQDKTQSKEFIKQYFTDGQLNQQNIVIFNNANETYFGTDKGLYKFNYEKEFFEPYTFLGFPDRLKNKYITFVILASRLLSSVFSSFPFSSIFSSSR